MDIVSLGVDIDQWPQIEINVQKNNQSYVFHVYIFKSSDIYLE